MRVEAKMCPDTLDIFARFAPEDTPRQESVPSGRGNESKRKKLVVSKAAGSSTRRKTTVPKASVALPTAQDARERFLRDTEVALRFSVGRQTIWRWVSRGAFPQPVKLSAGATRWRLSELVEFEAELSQAIPGKQASASAKGAREARK